MRESVFGSADTDLRHKADYRPEIKGAALIDRKFAIVYMVRTVGRDWSSLNKEELPIIHSRYNNVMKQLPFWNGVRVELRRVKGNNRKPEIKTL